MKSEAIFAKYLRVEDGQICGYFHPQVFQSGVNKSLCPFRKHSTDCECGFYSYTLKGVNEQNCTRIFADPKVFLALVKVSGNVEIGTYEVRSTELEVIGFVRPASGTATDTIRSILPEAKEVPLSSGAIAVLATGPESGVEVPDAIENANCSFERAAITGKPSPLEPSSGFKARLPLALLGCILIAFAFVTDTVWPAAIATAGIILVVLMSAYQIRDLRRFGRVRLATAPYSPS